MHGIALSTYFPSFVWVGDRESLINNSNEQRCDTDGLIG